MEQPPLSKIEIRLSAHRLRNSDVLSKSDPQVIVFFRGGAGGWFEIGKTEIIKNNLSPKWVTPIVVDYYFETFQELRFVVYDIDGTDNWDLLGELTISLSSLVSAQGRTIISPLTIPNSESEKYCGTLQIAAEELKYINTKVELKFRGSRLEKMDFFGKSDPYFVLSRKQDEIFVPVYKSDVIKKTLDPNWRDFSLPHHILNGGDGDRPLKIEVFDWNSNGKDELIGEVITSQNKLMETRLFPIKSLKGKETGFLELTEIEFVAEHSFLQYLAGGCHLSLTVAVDFSASNGELTNLNALHYIHKDSPIMNDYQQALSEIGKILLPYDSDGVIPAFGFNDKCFPIGNDCVRSIPELLDAYLRTVANIKFTEPTHIAPVINMVSHLAKQKCTQIDQRYSLLLIITDGYIADREALLKAFVEASYMPMSIIIVGVGEGNFASVKNMDSDYSAEKLIVAQRDIINFVPFRDYKKKSPAELAAAVLRGVPLQFMNYMKIHRIVPNAPLPPPQYQWN